MTRCIRKEVNLKSSVYNQTGQNYYEQLTAYNSMRSHLRRVLLAKSVIDTSNQNYLKRNQRCKVQTTSDSEIYLRLVATDDVIDTLAYDTRHHPMDMLRICLNAKHLDCCDCCNCNLDHQLRACSSQTYYEETDRMDRRQGSTSKHQRMMSPTMARSPKRKKIARKLNCNKEPKSARDIPYVVGPSTCFSRQRKCRYGKCGSKCLGSCAAIRFDSTMFKSRSQSPRQKRIDYYSMSSSASQCYDFDCEEKSTEALGRYTRQKEEEKKYIKFVYDITREIMQRGLYTDKELRDVFKKHINRYKGILNMNKMLYEIYQLKISLNVADSETDEELEDLIHAQKLLRVSEIRPPTPPKVLNENKVMEKLESYQKMDERSSKINTKSVMLIDANPEILVTERDVLMSLVEAGVDQEQVQYICKNLRYKSRDTDLTEAAQIETLETSYSPDLKVDQLVLEYKRVSAKTKIVESVRDISTADDTVKFSKKQEATSSMSNLVSVEDKLISVGTNHLELEDKGVSAETNHLELEDKGVSAETNHLELEDKGVFCKTETTASASDNSVEFSEKQNASSSTSNLVSTQDETVETTEKTESKTTQSEHNKRNRKLS
ncbi:PREDICTED: uncharacterized protein LOC105455401 [Wasmannia auropunctata]|uniref:uncharacterized protein LOC105455401 n=1 Tax=Wasmannia auropunctata TaxID=64793 RepID=UPI0005F0B2EE|nr:PREDICTED: uncharacterized protein LOC105455401 [Wasmannia auropunctata]